MFKFCAQLVHYSQWKSMRAFVCGSSMEIPLCQILARQCQVNLSFLDVDRMNYDNYTYAAHPCVTFPEAYNGWIIRIYSPDDVHTGYVRLIEEESITELQLSDLLTFDNNDEKHGPAILNSNNKLTLDYQSSFSNPSIDALESKRFTLTSLDEVYAVHSPYWPEEANEWITRHRKRGFPSKTVIKQVVKYGCDFVQVSHRFSEPHNGEWRFSFSKAELFIANSWTIPQKIVYSTLWVLNKKEIASGSICTYYFKTLMFWACEEKPARFWLNEKYCLIQAVTVVLAKMMGCLKSKFCANYFIRGNNMMDHLIGKDLSSEIENLQKIIEAYNSIEQLIVLCRQNELEYGTTIHYIESPAWIRRAFVIFLRVDNINDNYADLFNTNFRTDLQIALYVELSDIYRGLYYQQMSVSCVNVSDEHIYFLKSESHLLIAVNRCASGERDVLYKCSERFAIEMIKYFRPCDTEIFNGAIKHNVELNNERRSTAVRPNALTSCYQQKTLLYCQFGGKYENHIDQKYSSENISESRPVKLLVSRATLATVLTFTDDRFYQEWPGRSPTVNISWFIAKAYLANLYYTTQRDVSLAIQTCDDIIDVYQLSIMNKVFADMTFPVVLSTQWTSIYDKEIQELLGLYSLCSYVLDECSSRSVYLCVCPVQFALYVKVRMARLHALSEWSKYLHDYNEHIAKCYCDMNVKKTTWQISIAIVNI